MLKPRSVADRFWEKVQKGGEDDCWPWLACADDRGRGRFGIGSTANKARKMLFASRVSYELSFGSIEPGLVVCHRCDNPRCVNPRHLFLGTQSDNIKDMFAKGRQRDQRGSSHHAAKLTEADVLAIRDAAGITHRELGLRYGIVRAHVSGIRSGRAWLHVKPKGEKHG